MIHLKTVPTVHSRNRVHHSVDATYLLRRRSVAQHTSHSVHSRPPFRTKTDQRARPLATVGCLSLPARTRTSFANGAWTANSLGACRAVAARTCCATNEFFRRQRAWGF